MGKQLEIKFHPKSFEDIRLIYEWCEEYFGQRVAYKVATKIANSIERLSVAPLVGKEEPKFNKLGTGISYRSIKIKHSKVIYSVHDNYVYVHVVWDMRRNPNDMENEIRERI